MAEVAARTGVSAHSLHKWIKAVSPDKSEQHSKDLLEAKSEILPLRAQMRRLEEERNFLKKAARYVGNAFASASTRPGRWLGHMSSTTSKSSTTGRAATVVWGGISPEAFERAAA